MKCIVHGCPGEYEHRFIVHTVKRAANVIVFDNVPAEVCNVCSDILLAPETIRHLEELMQRNPEPEKHIPVYSYS